MEVTTPEQSASGFLGALLEAFVVVFSSDLCTREGKGLGDGF